MRILHLTASTFFGGPERQMLGLAQHLPSRHSLHVISFAEGNRCEAFLGEVRRAGFPARALVNDTPHLRAAVRELTGCLQDDAIDLVLCHGYKANLLGRIAARRAGLPAVAVARGWTGESRKVKLYEAADRTHLRLMDHVIAVSEGQAAKVRACGVPAKRLTVIRNAARLSAFEAPDPAFRERLRSHFSAGLEVSHIVVAAGRLSPEKGFDVLLEAAAQILKKVPTAGFVLFGEGSERLRLDERIRHDDLAERFVMPGFTDSVDRFLPWADLVVLPSHTEGLPNIALEAGAAGVAVVATAVGGTPEVVADGETGHLVPPGEPRALARRIGELLTDEPLRSQMGLAGRARMRAQFTFAAQAQAYCELFERLLPQPRRLAA